MRRIEIEERFRPYSHLIGTETLLPNSSWSVRIYPTRLEFFNALGSFDHELPPTNSLDNFTIIQDLERGYIRVHSKTLDYKIQHRAEEIQLLSKKAPIENRTFIVEERASNPLSERLFLGVTKHQNIERMRERSTPEELLPHLFLLQASIPKEQFQTHFLASYSGLFAPAKPKHLGINQPSDLNPIRDLFFREEQNRFIIRTPFHSGRLLNLQTEYGTLDIEWSNYKLRRIHLKRTKKGEIEFDLPSKLKGYRTEELSSVLCLDRFVQ